MAASRRDITCIIVGAKKAKLCQSLNEAERLIDKAFPNMWLHKEGSAGGWSFTNKDGVVMAATSFIEAYPYGRHWLALRPK